jgi:aryl-alcohol dehydrogenase-like predicted oxidoreductase
VALARPADRAESIATIHAALDAGINLIDTGDFYGSGHNEMLIREALAGINRQNFVLSVKFRALRDPSASTRAPRILKTERDGHTYKLPDNDSTTTRPRHGCE